MIRSLYLDVRERWWNRDRGRRIAALAERGRISQPTETELVEAMALQLAEIRSLPEAPDARR